MKLSEISRSCVDMLMEAKIERPFYVVDLILSKVLNTERAMLITKNNDEIPTHECEGILFMVSQRLKRVPLSYIIGEAEFYGHIFKVGEGCLIPRPETELLVEKLLELCPDQARFADWCTGSGCIGITLLLENAGYTGVGVDSSPKALEWAAINTKLHGLEDRFKLIRASDPSMCIMEYESFDFIAANPPYIPSCDMKELMEDVKDYEPHEALDGGQDGVDVYRMLFRTLPFLLKSGGVMGFEIAGAEQGKILLDIAPDNLVLKNKIFDYGGILRHLTWQKL